MHPLAQFSTRKPLLVILIWIAAVIGLTAANAAAGTDFRDSFSLPGTDSQAAYDFLGTNFPAASGSTDTIVWNSPGTGVTDPTIKADMTALLARLAEVPGVAGITSPYSPEGATQVSRDGTIAFASLHWNGQAYALPLDSVKQVGSIVSEANGVDGVVVAYGGQGANRLSTPSIGVGEIIGIGIAALVLLLALSSFAATTVPLLGAGAGVAAAVTTVGLSSNLGPLSSSAPIISVLLGLGIGIDYALFITNRHRRSLKEGRPVSESIIGASVTSGRAVIFAGVTVFIALAGMYVPRISFLTGLATSAAITVFFAVASSLTLVPAILQMYGMRVLNRRERRDLEAGTTLSPHDLPKGKSRGFILRHPFVAAIAALAVLGAIAIPAIGLRLGNADQGSDPAGSSTRTAYDLITQGFGPGANGPLIVTADLSGATSPTALTDLGATLQADPGVVAAIGPIPNAAGTGAMFQVIPSTDPQSAATVDLVNRVRDTYGVAAADAGITVHVGGAVATHVDFAQTIAKSLPVFFAVVVGLSMLVLAVAFRSIVLPAVGAALNLLSAAAAFGVIVAVFQWGWGHSIIGVGDGGPIEPFVPVILFAMLFGLSMDYQVFLVSRIAELWHATGDNVLAVRRGLTEVSRVIIAAAAIMIAVFGSFVTSDARIIKLIGLGLAVAIFLDAFVIRMVLMPALMRLLGRWNWWMPRWLDRILPHVAIDSGEDVSSAPGVPAKVGARA